MSIETLKQFFMWCSIVNIGILTLSFLLLLPLRGFVFEMHSKWFPMSSDQFNVVMYSFFGIYKVFVFIFSVVPYIALEIMS